MSDAPSPFSSNIPNFQVAWDSTSLGWFKTCARYYQYQMLLQYEPRGRSLHLDFGGWYAAGLEHYAHYRAQGMTHDDATVAMVRWVLTVTWGWSPPPDHKDANIKNRFTLIRSLVWNVEERQSSPFQTHVLWNGRPAVELTFNFAAFDIEGEPIHLTGHLDEVVSAEGDYWIRDDKTTKSALNAQYFKQYTPNTQMSQYSVAGRLVLDLPVRGVLVKAAQIGVNFTRFQTQQVPRPQAVLDEWMQETYRWITLAREYAIEDYWPMNDKACGNYGGCPFQPVCAVSPSHRKAWLEQDFVKREWNPLSARGDI